jgi:hypothetical protein
MKPREEGLSRSGYRQPGRKKGAERCALSALPFSHPLALKSLLSVALSSSRYLYSSMSFSEGGGPVFVINS